MPQYKDPQYTTAKHEFSRRLKEARGNKGWNQSELARQASLHMPDGKTVGKDRVSQYEKGMHLPNAAHLQALAKALRTTTDDLLPVRKAGTESGVMSIENAIEHGYSWVTISAKLPTGKALEVMRIVNEHALSPQAHG